MNWESQISRFHTVDKQDLDAPVSGRDLEQILSLYNKALVHVANDSTDIALIALRKILSRNPWFGHAAFLAACLLAREGREREALPLLQQALDTDVLPEAEKVRAGQCRQELLQLQDNEAAGAESVGEKMRGQITEVNASAILEKIEKRARVKVASEKERQEVIRQAEAGSKEETRIENKRLPIEYLRPGLIVLAGALLVILLVLAVFRWIPDLARGRSEQRQATGRLEWLLTELENRSGANPVIDEILKEYEDRFFATEQTRETTPEMTTTVPVETTGTDPAPSPEPTGQPTLTPAPEPTPTPTETMDPAVGLLLAAADNYEQALDIYETDLMTAAEYLLQSREILTELPPQTSAPDITENAGELSSLVESLIARIARSAAERFRVAGMDLFNSRDYEQALPLFLTAYALRPDAYGGGVAYYCGRCYQLLDEPELARPYFEYVIDNFAGRDIASSAAARLREMGY